MRRLDHILAVFGLLLLGSGGARFTHLMLAHNGPQAVAEQCGPCLMSSAAADCSREQPSPDDPAPDRDHDCTVCDMLAASYAAALPQPQFIASCAAQSYIAPAPSPVHVRAAVSPRQPRAPPACI